MSEKVTTREAIDFIRCFPGLEVWGALGVKSSNVHKSSPITRSYPGQTFRHNRIAHGLELQVPITRVVGSSLRKFAACWFLPRFAVVNPLPVLPLSIFGFRGTIRLLKYYESIKREGYETLNDDNS